MKDQVAKLFGEEYKISEAEFAKFMSRLYEHPYQKERSIQIVALDGDKVVGFQSFFYWPYSHNNITFNSYQSGNSIVHPDYRGKRLFARMLDYINEDPKGKTIDFLMGFPVQASYNSFIKNGWNNLMNLQWYVKPVNLFGFLVPKSRLNKYFTKANTNFTSSNPNEIRLSEEKDFRSWKEQLVYEAGHYFQFTHSENNKTVIFDLKFQVRKKIINELIIGSVRFEQQSESLVETAFTALLKQIKKAGCITMVSIACNEHVTALKDLVERSRFKKIENKIFFIVKPFKDNPALLNPSLWNIGRADIDTW